MKLFVLSPDSRGKIDGTNKVTLLDHLPQTRSLADADAVVIPISFFPDYVFSYALEQTRKPIVAVDYSELGWDFWNKPGRRTHIFGDGQLPEYLQTNPEWAKLDAWLAANPPVLTFKRELLEADAGPRVKPIEFLCTLAPVHPQAREEFNARPFDVFNCFGYSHPSRPRLHGQIFEAMSDRGINVISDWSQFNGLPMPIPPRTWVSMYSPWWCRQPLSRVMDIQRQSKLSVSLPGAGTKSFRHAESPVDCVMAMQSDELAWSYPWVNMENCIRLPYGSEVEMLMASSHLDSLYDIYVASQENIQKYRAENYVREYVLKNIEEAL